MAPCTVSFCQKSLHVYFGFIISGQKLNQTMIVSQQSASAPPSFTDVNPPSAQYSQPLPVHPTSNIEGSSIKTIQQALKSHGIKSSEMLERKNAGFFFSTTLRGREREKILTMSRTIKINF